jgi:diguanylate cyclase (GGDEF)-like protein
MQEKYVHFSPDNNLFIDYDVDLEKKTANSLIASLKINVINCIEQSTCELTLLSELNDLVDKHGNIACQVIFQVTADLHVNRDEAMVYWEKFYQHSSWLHEKVGRPLPLVATICDYLSLNINHLNHKAKLTTHEHFNSLVNHSTVDHLTGLFNRNCFNDILKHLLALTQREDTELSLVFLDLDDFKLVNDKFGHQMGDFVLNKFGKLLSNSIRQSDIALRYGGEEFVILMPNTDRKEAMILSNRIRLKVKSMPFIENGTNLHMSISGGLAVYPTHAKTADELVYSADNALYQAKGAGKNNIKVFKNENRHYLRVPLVKNIKVKEINFNGATIQDATCHNISIGGVLLETSQHYHVRDSIQIAIKFTDENPILIFGSVVRVEEVSDSFFNIAVSFSFGDMEKLAKSKIAGIIQKNEENNRSN